MLAGEPLESTWYQVSLLTFDVRLWKLIRR